MLFIGTIIEKKDDFMGIIKLKNSVCVSAVGAVSGKKEYDGAFGDRYDEYSDDDTFGKKTFEQAEEEMQKRCFAHTLKKGGFKPSDIDAIFAGDLMNQCTASSYGLIDYGVQYFGLFGACSTMAEAILLSSLCVDGGYFNRCAAIVSSHNCTAERQFRMPIEYGGQRTPTAQWTVTGSGCAVIEKGNYGMYIKDVLPGIPVDRGVNDAANMGAAMAPAAADTLKRYFEESGKKPCDFDVILSGDLGFEGHGLTSELLSLEGYDPGENYLDCGMLLYKPEQDVHSGGSGCGCSALGLAVYLYERFCKKEIKNALFIGTGALMSPMSVAQGHSIPGIAHLIHFSSEV